MKLLSIIFFSCCSIIFTQENKNILITGYWPPTNEIVKNFSDNPTLNPQGWQGKNWQNSGYNLYSFFPTFPNGLKKENGCGQGNLEVDYQDTSRDFWQIVEKVKPVAIIAFGLGHGPWEIEFNARNLPAKDWRKDYIAPQYPMTKPDITRKDNFTLHSTLPVENIAQKINAANLGIKAWVDWKGNPGKFLCEYMAYHVMWYQNLHSNGKDPCLAAGFIHVGSGVSIEVGRKALKITLQETIAHISKKAVYKSQSLEEALRGQQKKIYVTRINDNQVLKVLLSQPGVCYRYLGDDINALDENSSRFFVSDLKATATNYHHNSVKVYTLSVDKKQKISYVDLKLGFSLLDD
ncbi:hypothetical protein [Candidatus Uabimicrobium sp. HlEnr_7]|uniref:pyroglutamyl-peptidase I family protein n=1 Tax=Candidatus Uabimicrobium helgolandensis TaxID=3095367 RepID=UPI003557098D